MSIEDERRAIYDMVGHLERRLDSNGDKGESDLRLVSERLLQMRRDIDENDKRIDALTKERDSLFRWGILALGSVVFALGSLLVSIFMGGRIK